MRRAILIMLTITISNIVQGQKSDSLVGKFEFRQYMYYSLTLTLNKNGEFELYEFNHINSIVATGTWKLNKNKIKLHTKQLSRHYQQTEKVIAKEDTWLGKVEEIKVLSNDEVFIEKNNEHVHLKRSD